MNLILQKFKGIKNGLSAIKDKDSVIHVFERIVDLVSKEYPHTSNYSKKLKEMDFDIRYPYSVAKNIKNIDNLLQIIIDDLEIKYDVPPLPPMAQNFIDEIIIHDINVKKKVFIVHGHNEVMKQSVARFIETIGLKAIILSEQANKGRTTLEKFHFNANVDMAIILLSPDDKGYSVKEGPRKAKFRARQNVIFELGYFIGKFNREKVITLVENPSNFENPSDFHGVVYTPFDGPDGAWKASVLKELKANGFDIDSNKVF